MKVVGILRVDRCCRYERLIGDAMKGDLALSNAAVANGSGQNFVIGNNAPAFAQSPGSVEALNRLSDIGPKTRAGTPGLFRGLLRMRTLIQVICRLKGS